MSFLLIIALLSGLIAVTFNKKESSTFQGNYIFPLNKELQEVFFNLGSIENYSTYSLNQDLTANYQDNTTLFPANAQIVKGFTQDKHGNDSIILRYQGNNSSTITNCAGSPLSTTQSTISHFFVTNNLDLACATVQNETSPDTIAFKTINNVEILRIRYGEDTNHDGQINRYVSADQPDLSYERVLAIKMIILLRTTETINPLFDSGTYTIEGMTYGPYNDHFLRKVLTLTLPVNNATNKNSSERSPNDNHE